MISYVYPCSFINIKDIPAQSRGVGHGIIGEEIVSLEFNILMPFKVGVQLQHKVANLRNYVGIIQ